MIDADVTGVVLAGGGSRRFGEDKARHRIEDRSMIERVVDSVAAICPTVLVSVGMDPRSYPLSNVRYVQDHFSDAGPLAGIHAAMLASDSSWLLVVACDMPFVTPEALRRLLAARTPRVEAVLAQENGGRLHPLCGCYHRALLPELSAYLDGGHRAVHDFVAEINHAAVTLPGGPLRNINRRQDLVDENSSRGPSATPRT